MENFNILGHAAGEYELLFKIKTNSNSELSLFYDKICGRKILVKSGRIDLIENEARLMSKLSGRGIPDIYSCFEMEGKAYLFRQYIEGRSLRECIVSDGAFSPKKAISIGVEVCEIISRLHRSEPPIIHRDIKSDNIIITDDGEIFVIDMGISREYDPSSSRDTQVMGTPVTAPPEQFGYGQTDERSDVYALGVLLNELVTGSEKIDLSELPSELVSIIKRCTEFAPEKRFRNADELQAALLKKQKSSHKAASLILSACAAAAVSVFIFLFNGRAVNIPDTSVTDNKETVNEYKKVTDTKTPYTVELDDEYQGDYALSKTIPRNVLESYEGDIRITLDIETAGLYNYANFIPIALVGENNVCRNLVEEIDCTYDRNGDGFIDVKQDQTECTFILSHDAVEMLGKNGIGFQGVNITFKSASLVDADI